MPSSSRSLAAVLGIHDSAIDGRTVFPDVLTVFTVRAFAAFFLALLVGVASLFLSRWPETWVTLARMGLYLVVPITLAALLNISVFDFAARPGGLIYIGLYVIVGAGEAYGIWWYRKKGGSARPTFLAAATRFRRAAPRAAPGPRSRVRRTSRAGTS